MGLQGLALGRVELADHACARALGRRATLVDRVLPLCPLAVDEIADVIAELVAGLWRQEEPQRSTDQA